MAEMEFSEWLKRELDRRNMKPFHLAKKAQLNASTILHLLAGERALGAEGARAIAAALDVPQAVVFLAAGILTEPITVEGEEIDPQLMTGLRELQAMTASERALAIEQMQAIRRNRGGDNPKGRGREKTAGARPLAVAK